MQNAVYYADKISQYTHVSRVGEWHYIAHVQTVW